jgi:hypothetical protein
MPELLELLLGVVCEMVGDWFSWRVNLGLILLAVLGVVGYWILS